MATVEKVLETLDKLSGVNAVFASATVDNSCVAVKSGIVVADEIVSLKPVLDNLKDVSFTRAVLDDSPLGLTPVARIDEAAVFRDGNRDENDENLEYTWEDEDGCESLKDECTMPALVDVNGNTKRLLSVKTIDSDPGIMLFGERKVETEMLLSASVLLVDIRLVVLSDDICVLVLSWEEPFADDVVMASEVAREDEVE